ncbi:TetR/AcrR family transcriptional regulator [Simiduia curdlanivorans]|uniref:TetR/AcrR family transcriptional regulator n=1 Tax=Simiduia curdlanivorans TaxID=1492769 RepID=A0ABV8V9H3_9GAMM|nr:TetR/AcrR family transcriptional regulator [Simiduia curdlanivorans]MDN3639344.1 TetR/AcrR family transcriptional regulator [Simiduia curdlanivorans]
MAYQATEHTDQVKQANLESLLHKGHQLVAKSGFQNLSISKVTAAAGMASGNLYRYFNNKDALAVAIFERATEREITAVFDSVNQTAAAALTLEMLLSAFCERALANPKLAYALIAEPVSPAVEAARLRYRAIWAERFASVIEAGIKNNEFAQQSAMLAAVAIVGAMAEAVLHQANHKIINRLATKPLVAFCLRGLGKGEADEK